MKDTMMLSGALSKARRKFSKKAILFSAGTSRYHSRHLTHAGMERKKGIVWTNAPAGGVKLFEVADR